MDYKTRIEKYQRAAEQKFSNWGGQQPQANFAGGMYHSPGDEGFQNFNGGIEELDPNDRTLTVTVNNSESVDQTARIFGSVKDLTDANAPAGVSYTVDESSHLEVKTELLQNPFRIVGMKYVVGNVAQYSNTLRLFEESSTGGLIRRIWQPLNYRSAQNQITTQIDAPSFELLVNAKSYIEFTIDTGETVTFTFSLAEKAEMKNSLRGKSVRRTAGVQAPSGLPQLDMKIIPGRQRSF